MIIDSPSIIQLALGTDRRLPESGDAQVIIPNTLLPCVDVMQVTRSLPNASTPIGESSLTESQRINNNQAASQDVLITIPPGLYILECFLSSLANALSTLTAADTGVRITLDFGSSIVTLLGLYQALNAAAQVGGTYTVLLPVQAQLIHRVQITPVGQTILSRASVNVRRIL